MTSFNDLPEEVLTESKITKMEELLRVRRVNREQTSDERLGHPTVVEITRQFRQCELLEWNMNS